MPIYTQDGSYMSKRELYATKQELYGDDKKVDEKKFQEWYRGHAKKLGLSPNPDDPEHFYDWRGAFREGAEPDAEGHWPSKFKREGHPRLIIDGIDTRTGQPVPLLDDSPSPSDDRNSTSNIKLAADTEIQPDRWWRNLRPSTNIEDRRDWPPPYEFWKQMDEAISRMPTREELDELFARNDELDKKLKDLIEKLNPPE